MWVKIIGMGWIIMGIYFFFRSSSMKMWIHRKSRKIVRRGIVTLLLIGGLSLISIFPRIGGISGGIILVAGIITILKILLFINRKVSDKSLLLLEHIPETTFRISSIIMILIGVLILRKVQP